MAKKDISTLTFKPSQLRQALLYLSRVETSKGVGRPAFIWGPPGVGKSEILKGIADELGYNFVDVRLSQMEPTDLRGIPFPSTDESGNTAMRWSPPSFYVSDHSRPTLYLFDEMNTAPPSIQAAAYQIVLDRKIGEYNLGPRDVVFAAGNRDTDRGATFKMATPLMNRFVHMEIHVDFDDWQEWAINNQVHPSVVGYLTWQKHELFDFTPSSASRGFPTPRSWTFVSEMLSGGAVLPDQVLLGLIAGAVGEGIAIKFFEYRKLTGKLPNPSEILEGKVTQLTKEQDETSIHYALTVSLCYELSDLHLEAARAGGATSSRDLTMKQMSTPEMAEWTKKFDNTLKFMFDNFKPEMVILAIRSLIGQNRFGLSLNLSLSKMWKTVISQYADFIYDRNE